MGVSMPPLERNVSVVCRAGACWRRTQFPACRSLAGCADRNLADETDEVPGYGIYAPGFLGCNGECAAGVAERWFGAPVLRGTVHFQGHGGIRYGAPVPASRTRVASGIAGRAARDKPPRKMNVTTHVTTRDPSPITAYAAKTSHAPVSTRKCKETERQDAEQSKESCESVQRSRLAIHKEDS